MKIIQIFMLCAFMLTAIGVMAKENAQDDSAKLISGMSLVGNKDAPKSLYIVPWKTSEIGLETELVSSLLDESLVPVDKPVFMRELDFYRISNEQ